MQIFAKKKKRGFTLIELLVVIAIIGMLAGIVLVSMGGARSKARDAKRESDIRQISTAMEMYYDDSQTYTQVEGGGAASSGRIDWLIDIGNGYRIPNYLDPLPTDPGGGADACNTGAGNYCAFDSPAGSEYCIWAALESGRFFAASEKGTKLMTAVPAALATCGW